jgi:hydrogenase nickel incorporation protein HypA/HybF
MHELAITESMLNLVLEQAEKIGAKEIGKINLVIGEMSGVVDECVQFYFDFLSKGTIAEGAQLSFKMVPPTARCRHCDRVFELKEFDWTCPNCGGNNMEIVAGNELFVESMEVE